MGVTKKIVCLQVHNDYLIPGGETRTAKLIADLLERRGMEIIRFYKNNSSISSKGALGKFKVGLDSLYNHNIERELTELLSRHKVDFALVHNVTPIISNAVYRILINNDIPIVKYVQNYNLICLNGALDNNEVCYRCMHNNLLGVKHSCYKRSAIYTLIRYLIKQDLDKKYRDKIAAFMTNSSFVKMKHVQCGLDPSKMHIMYNYIACETKTDSCNRKEYLYFGRLSKEKGAFTTIRAFEQLPDLSLSIVGSGEIEDDLKKYVIEHDMNNVSFKGSKCDAELMDEVWKAKCVIVPSEWDEPLPRTILEAYSQGTPVIGSDKGGIPEMIKEGRTGYIFKAGDVDNLIETIKKFNLLSDEAYMKMRSYSRGECDEQYTEEKYFKRFMEVISPLLRKNNQ